MKTKTRVFRFIVTILFCLAMIGVMAAGLVFGPDFLGQFTFREGLRTLNGEPVENIEGFLPKEARMAYIVLYRTECAACTKYLQELSRMDLEQFGGRLAIVAMNMDGSEYAVRQHLKENDIQTDAQFPVLIGLPHNPEKIPSVPVTIIMLGDGKHWEYSKELEGVRAIEGLETLAYRVLLRAWGGLDFWGGSLKTTGWHESEGHHAVAMVYTAEYEPSAIEVLEWLNVMVGAASLEPEHAIYIHIIVYHEKYEYYVAFSMCTDYKHIQGIYIPDTEEEAVQILATYFFTAAGEDYYWLDGRIPLWDGTEAAAWHYARYAAILAGHPWVSELGEMPESGE
jgi:hypothetical protein